MEAIKKREYIRTLESIWERHKKFSDVLILGRREGVKQDAKMSLFLCPYYWGREGVQVNKTNVF